MSKEAKKQADVGNGAPAAMATPDLAALVDSNGANIAAMAIPPQIPARCASVVQFRHQFLPELVRHHREDEQDAYDDGLQI